MGITPAHAGKTSLPRPMTSSQRDHPRACGENPSRSALPSSGRGSPPRMRGKLLGESAGACRLGITPAHAGKTLSGRTQHKKRWDHPRACGENRCSSPCRHPAWGSPPRMRGKPGEIEPRGAPVGITPAHAGKTLRKGRISVVDPSPQPRSSLTSRRADASIGSQRAPCAAPV